MPEQGLYFNRELSWLRFNERVLEEAASHDLPLYERLRFLSIFASNLDEFYMVRIGSLMDRILITDNAADNKTLMTPEEQIRAANHAVKELYPVRNEVYQEIMQGLEEYGLLHDAIKELDGGEKRVLRAYFENEVLPLLSPQIVDSKHPFPHLENRQLHIGVRLRAKDKTLYGIVPLPHQIDRVYKLSSSKGFVLLEDIVMHYAEDIFEIYSTEAKAVIRVTRNADIDLSESLFDEGIEYREMMKEMLKKRRKLSPVRLETSGGADGELRDFFLDKLGLSKGRCFECTSPLDMSFVGQIGEFVRPRDKEALLYAPLEPQWPSELAHEHAVTPQLQRKDTLLSYPYHTMRPFLDMLREAAEDKSVVSIKMTLYRVSSRSKVVQYLCAAAENGKDVVVIVELRARFDEQNNIDWATTMEKAGCKVIYGIDGYKVHGKVALITRKLLGKPQHLVSIATGNFNESTARAYTDLAFFTTEPIICGDAVLFFRNMEIGNLYGNYRKLLVAPANLKSRLLDLISQEIAKALEGSPARITFKMNSLTDKELIDKLIAASQAGVPVTLIIRGICCLCPGVEGFTDNIEVRSIVGRFLEHPRIFLFGEGESAKLYIGSADLMTRNTERRVEVLAPIENPALIKQVKDMLAAQSRDTVKARVLSANGTYHQVEGGVSFDSQLAMYAAAYGKPQAEPGKPMPRRPLRDTARKLVKKLRLLVSV